MNPWIVVPTLGNRDASLVTLLRAAQMPSVVVWTHPEGATDDISPELWESSGSFVIDPADPMNIQRWWNAGIEHAVQQGADIVVVTNDDISAEPGALLELAAHIEPGAEGSPMLVWPEDTAHASTRVTGITGYCFALDPARIRPDEAFSWWWGDHDLELRARAMQPDGGAMAVDVPGIRHLRTDYRYDRPVTHLIDADRRLFARRYPALMGGWPA
ncbi:MAG TPA: hypothetical protein VFP28_02555 [Gemmatimonadales bacterium]|nr:hypothetical protein [Gemmatimonadales bacterium]